METNEQPMSEATVQPNVGLIQSIATKLSLSSVVSTARAMLTNLGYNHPSDYIVDANANDGADGSLAVCDGGCIIDQGEVACVHGNPSLTAVVSTYDMATDTYTMDGVAMDVQPAGDVPEVPVGPALNAVSFDNGFGTTGTVIAPTMAEAVDTALAALDGKDIVVDDDDDDDDDEDIEIGRAEDIAIVRADLHQAEAEEGNLAQDLSAAEVFADDAEIAADHACQTADAAEDSVRFIRSQLADKQEEVDSLADALVGVSIAGDLGDE
jgi:hypothetical protein